jgi:hypothetical protein
MRELGLEPRREVGAAREGSRGRERLAAGATPKLRQKLCADSPVGGQRCQGAGVGSKEAMMPGNKTTTVGLEPTVFT